MNTQVTNVVTTVKRNKCINNVQKVFLSLVRARNNRRDGWVPRTSLRVPSVTARIRDLRKPSFGGFQIECATANQLGKVSRSIKTKRQTFYRIVPASLTTESVTKVMKGVI